MSAGDERLEEARRLLGWPPLSRAPKPKEVWVCWVVSEAATLDSGHLAELVFSGWDKTTWGGARPLWVAEKEPPGPWTVVPLYLKSNDPARPYMHLTRAELDALMNFQLRVGRKPVEITAFGDIYKSYAMPKFNDQSYTISTTNSTLYFDNATTTPVYDVTYKAVWDPMKGAYTPQQIQATAPGKAPAKIDLSRDEEDPIKWLRRRVEEICWKPA